MQHPTRQTQKGAELRPWTPTPLIEKIMNKDEKIREILSGEILLTIESKFKKPSRFYTSAFYAVAVLLATCVVAVGFLMHNLAFLFGSIVFASILLVALLLTIRFSLSRRNPLLICSKGIVVEPIICEPWNEIESYAFEDFTTITGKRQGVTLKIYNEGGGSRTNGRGGSLFRILGYLFNDQQEKQLEDIFQVHRIKKKW